MFAKRCIVIGFSLLVALVGILVACAAPASTTTPSPTTTVTPTPAAGSLAQIIAEAQKEGTVSAMLRTGFTPKAMERLKKELKGLFGVDLNITYSPTMSYPNELAQAIMEYQAKATPTYDLMTFTTGHILTGNNAGIFEKVDWKALMTKDTNPEAVRPEPFSNGIIYFTRFQGLMYNPEKVPAAQAPETLSELTDPKWTGKLGVFNYPNSWARRAYFMGKEKTFADLRAILKNKAIQGPYVSSYNRYLLGEVWLTYISSVYLGMARDKGMPVAWKHLDYAEVENAFVVVRKGAAHPNAAKLVALYMASPAGAKFTLEESGAGNLYYPGNYEHDLSLEVTRQGVPLYEPATYPGLTEFQLTDEEKQWEKEIDLIFKGAG